MDSLLSFIDIQGLISTIASFIPQVIAALIIFFVFRTLYKVSRKPLVACCDRIHLEKPVTKLLVDSIYKYTVLIFGGLMAVKQLGIDVGAVLAGLGVVGIAVGFAAQDSMSNIIAGFIIFLDKPFKVGDWIKTSDHYGKVYEITMRSTRIQTEDNTYIIIPNKSIIDEVVVNHSKYGHLRVIVSLSIAYKESIEEARTVLLDAAYTLPNVLKEPPAEVVVTELGDSGVCVDVEVWIDEADEEEPTRDALTEVCKNALDKAGIEIPFPHLQLLGVPPVSTKSGKKVPSIAKAMDR